MQTVPAAHFSFTQTNDDYCALQQQYKQMIGPYNWMMFSDFHTPCFGPTLSRAFSSVPSDIIDIESDIHNLFSKNTKCMQQTKNVCSKPINTVSCASDMYPEYSRLSDKQNHEIMLNRFIHTPCNAQNIDTIHSNSYIGMNSRLFIKDNNNNKKQNNNYIVPVKQNPGLLHLVEQGKLN